MPFSWPPEKIREVGRGMVGVLEGRVVVRKYLHSLAVALHPTYYRRGTGATDLDARPWQDAGLEGETCH